MGQKVDIMIENLIDFIKLKQKVILISTLRDK